MRRGTIDENCVHLPIKDIPLSLYIQSHRVWVKGTPYPQFPAALGSFSQDMPLFFFHI